MLFSPTTGIVNPIEAKVRKGKGAVGAYGNERTQQSLQDFPVIDSEEEEEKVHLSRQNSLYTFLHGSQLILTQFFFLFFPLCRNFRRSSANGEKIPPVLLARRNQSTPTELWMS